MFDVMMSLNINHDSTCILSILTCKTISQILLYDSRFYTKNLRHIIILPLWHPLFFLSFIYIYFVKFTTKHMEDWKSGRVYVK